MSGRPWTSHEDAEVRRCYGREPAATLATRLGRTVKAVYLRALLLGCAKQYRARRPGFSDFVRRRYAEGWSDHEISAAWGCDRHTVLLLRRRLGLPSNRLTSDHYRQRVRDKTAEQLHRCGAKSLGEVRVQAFRRYARECGWPDDLRPRAVQILNALRSGPKTRRQLAAAIGMPWKGSRKSLTSNDPEGSYLAHLIRRGLVVSLGKICKGHGRGRSTQVYSLALNVKPQPRKESEHERSTQSPPATAEAAGPGQRYGRLDGGAAAVALQCHHRGRHDRHHEGAGREGQGW